MAKTKARLPKADDVPVCTPVFLTGKQAILAAERAVEINPANAPFLEGAGVHEPAAIAALTGSYWGTRGADVTVSFMEATPADLRDRILSHANAWGEFCNVRFRWTQRDGQIRISRGNGGYYSYLGTDCLGIPRNRQTMNLQGFTMNTSEAEYRRVVRHEFGHALGMPHEHMRRELVARIDEAKAVAYFGRTQGWSPQDVRQQVLTPLDERSLTGASPSADQDSIMCYQLPGSITRDGQPIRGGADFSPTDRQYAAKIYPKPGGPIDPPPGGSKDYRLVVVGQVTSVRLEEVRP